MSGSLDLFEVETSCSRSSARVDRPKKAGCDLQAPAPLDALLSRRELEVLELLAQGFTNKEIAVLLYVSFETVKTHVAHILKKTGAKNRAAAAVCLIRARRGKSPGPLPLKDAFSSSTIAAEGGVDYEASPRVSNETTYLVRSDDERGK